MGQTEKLRFFESGQVKKGEKEEETFQHKRISPIINQQQLQILIRGVTNGDEDDRAHGISAQFEK